MDGEQELGRLTPKRSLVQSQYRAPVSAGSEAGSREGADFLVVVNRTCHGQAARIEIRCGRDQVTLSSGMAGRAAGGLGTPGGRCLIASGQSRAVASSMLSIWAS
jgi:hypothetical protein